jgi:electron transport complex protein RnfB
MAADRTRTADAPARTAGAQARTADAPASQRYLTRREFLARAVRAGTLFGFGVFSGLFHTRTAVAGEVWQIDPSRCTQCGNCATACVLPHSAVKCVHSFKICGYCKLCGAYFRLETRSLTTGAENQICPAGAMIRSYVEEPYYEYRINEELCIGCGKCVKGCGDFGNGSLFLQVRHDRCRGCNDCAIARACPSGAFRRIPREQAYLLKGVST